MCAVVQIEVYQRSTKIANMSTFIPDFLVAFTLLPFLTYY